MGLAIILCMIMTTILLNFLFNHEKSKVVYHHPCNYNHLLIELSFLVANITKFAEGGYVTLIIAVVLISIMTIWYLAKQINKSYTKL
jgi:KUP system potassium uptake protein